LFLRCAFRSSGGGRERGSSGGGREATRLKQGRLLERRFYSRTNFGNETVRGTAWSHPKI